MSIDRWLPSADSARGAHLLDYLEVLLARAMNLASGRDWRQVAAASRSDLDEARSKIASTAPDLVTFDSAAALVHAHLAQTLADVGGIDPLVGIAACARAIDDLWGDVLATEWAAFVAERGNRIDPGDIVISAGTDHIADIYPPGQAIAANRLRADDHPGRTRRASLFFPRPEVPPVFVDRTLSRVLAPALAGGREHGPRCWVAAAPNSSSDEWDYSTSPIRPRDERAHIDAAVRAVTEAVDLNAAVIVLPEFCGFVNAVDELRRIRPPNPTLVVAGSGHDAIGGGLRNVASAWIARADGTMPADHPVRTLKRLPYDGSLGTEALTEVGDSITVFISGPWRLVFGICRDLFDTAITDALAQLGANLLLVPACSPKTTNLAQGAESVAVGSGGFALVANGPPNFTRPGRNPVEVATTIWCTPLDRTSPRLLESTGTAGLMIVDLASHRLTPRPWP